MNHLFSIPISTTLPPFYSDPVYSNIEPVEVDQIAELQNLIRSFRDLPDNWAGPGSISPSGLTIENTSRFIEALPSYMIDSIYLDDITPAPHGTIVIDIQKGENLLSVEIGDENMGYYLEIAGDIIRVKDLDTLNFQFKTDQEWVEILSEWRR